MAFTPTNHQPPHNYKSSLPYRVDVLMVLLDVLHMCAPICFSWKDLEGPPKKLASRVKRFFSAKKDRLSDIVPRFVVVDGIERQEPRSSDGTDMSYPNERHTRFKVYPSPLSNNIHSTATFFWWGRRKYRRCFVCWHVSGRTTCSSEGRLHRLSKSMLRQIDSPAPSCVFGGNAKNR